MYPTLARLVRVLPRSQVDPALRPVPVPVRSDVPKQSLIEILQKRKEEAGEAYPANIRIESLEAKTALRELRAPAVMFFHTGFCPSSYTVIPSIRGIHYSTVRVL
ncbi:hypothetical protein VTO73DRAFT_13689 [Trametes versicolor]